jgi:acetyl-CoA carboxylase biotin carboxylase subunit
VANRGEIAVRILRAAREMGWVGIAVYSDADRSALHVRLADEAYRLGPPSPTESYLNIPALLEVARKARAQFVHPGYGFLAENADFARVVGEAGLTFVGPSPEAIASMGNKVEARELARSAGVPVTPGTDALPLDAGRALEAARSLGFPVLVKAAFGGGGRGMRVCHDPEALRQALETARSEAARAFGDGTLYLERWLEAPRHIEVQILGDRHGNVLALGERECSIQRRHQKLIEETPSVAVTPERRRQLMEAAVRLARRIGYVGAGTVEFLMDQDGSFYFLEMNTRLQVEHPVTEMVTGWDLVKAQLLVAQGERLETRQEEIAFRGHAIEARICAEDPLRDFAPQGGRIGDLRLASGPGIRNDMGVTCHSEVPTAYDSLIGKVIAWGRDRKEARGRLLRAMEEMWVEGIPTNIPFHRWCLQHPEFVAGRISTRFIQDHYRAERLQEEASWELAVAAAWALEQERYRLSEEAASHGPRAPSPWAMGSRPSGA